MSAKCGGNRRTVHNIVRDGRLGTLDQACWMSGGHEGKCRPVWVDDSWRPYEGAERIRHEQDVANVTHYQPCYCWRCRCYRHRKTGSMLRGAA